MNYCGHSGGNNRHQPLSGYLLANRRRAAIIAVIFAAAASCENLEPTRLAISETSDSSAMRYANDLLVSELPISVCFEPDVPDWFPEVVRAAVFISWEQYSNVRFQWMPLDCEFYRETSGYEVPCVQVGVTSGEIAATRNVLIGSTWHGASTCYDFGGGDDATVVFGDELSAGAVSTSAIHEFGHVLGLEHETHRSDAVIPEECLDFYDSNLGQLLGPSPYGATNYGSYDSDSIMNYCNIIGNPNEDYFQDVGVDLLSSGDEAGIAYLYGFAGNSVAAPGDLVIENILGSPSQIKYSWEYPYGATGSYRVYHRVYNGSTLDESEIVDVADPPSGWNTTSPDTRGQFYPSLAVPCRRHEFQVKAWFPGPGAQWSPLATTLSYTYWTAACSSVSPAIVASALAPLLN